MTPKIRLDVQRIGLYFPFTNTEFSKLEKVKMILCTSNWSVVESH